MKLTFSLLKRIIPELNRQVITPERIIHVFYQQLIEFYEINMPDNGAFVSIDGRNFVFLKQALVQIIRHEVLLHEGCHALIHYPAPFLLWRQQLEAEVFSLVGMMPLSDLKRLNGIKHQLEPESYELLMKRNLANQRWKL